MMLSQSIPITLIENPSLNNSLVNSKYCHDCNKELLNEKFKVKGTKKDGSQRYDKYCQDHRNKRDKASKSLKKILPKGKVCSGIEENIAPLFRINTKKLIEPLNNETEKIINNIKFPSLDNDKTMTIQETKDAIFTFNNFISILCEEYEELKGHAIYVK